VSENLLTDNYLDLRGIVCPVNFVKCCLALENLSSSDILKVDLDIGESETSVINGLQEKGYKLKILYKDFQKVTLIISSDQK
jgi:TusA-related sulfurtransferase